MIISMFKPILMMKALLINGGATEATDDEDGGGRAGNKAGLPGPHHQCDRGYNHHHQRDWKYAYGVDYGDDRGEYNGIGDDDTRDKIPGIS